MSTIVTEQTTIAESIEEKAERLTKSWIKEDNHKDLLEFIRDYEDSHPVSFNIKKNLILCDDLVFIFKFDNNLFINGDQEYSFGISELFQGMDYPTFSFRCLSRFFHKNDITEKNIDSTINSILKGDIEILDYTEDEILKGAKSKPPKEKGFTWTGHGWHRPSSFLFHHGKKNITILLGQDEGTYFGCELNTNVKTISAAFNSLIPKEAKGYVARQGEWFIVPAKEPDVSNFGGFELEQADLPVENDYSNKHTIEGYIRIKDNKIYACCFLLNHPEHDVIDLSDKTNKWYTFVRNTAKRSFSEEGVD